MTTLTDLPNEILTAIFREFLSKELTNHKYLCNWIVEPDALAVRANLCSLALVSRRLFSIALPLLYEQLFDPEDIYKILLRIIRNRLDRRAGLRGMSYVRYLRIEVVDTVAGELPGEFLQTLRKHLVQCTKILHLCLEISGKCSDNSAFILNLAKIPVLKNLRSLQVRLERSMDARHDLFRDCCQFQALTGLGIVVGKSMQSIASPDQPLLHLKHLQTAYLDNARETSACMALACPNSLEILEFWGLHSASPSITSVPQIFGHDTWTSLAILQLDCESSLARDSFLRGASRLPGLRRLKLCLPVNTPLGDSVPILPHGLDLFCIAPRDMTQLLDSLTLIASKDWLGKRMHCIEVDFDERPENSWGEETYTMAHLLSVAQQAVDGTRSKGIVLAPEDIMDQALMHTRFGQTS